MLRISEKNERSRKITLFLEGQVVGPWVDELRNACQLPERRDQQLVLDLANVAFVDQAGANVLAELCGLGAKLVNTTPFVATQLKAI